MYKTGDIINNKWVVLSNHCGLPWPVDEDGNQYLGCLCVVPLKDDVAIEKDASMFVDAKSGVMLSLNEWEVRKNNIEFNYENKWKSHTKPAKLDSKALSLMVNNGILQ